MRHFIFLIFLFSTFSFSAFGQTCCPYIDEIKIIPSFPTEGEDIYLVTQVTLPEDGMLISADVNAADSIVITQCYAWCCLFSTPTIYDTIFLGTLNEGTYPINLFMNKSDSQTICENEVLEFDTLIWLNVDKINGLATSAEKSLFLIPNPSKDMNFIHFNDANNVNIYLKDMSGSVLLSQHIEKTINGQLVPFNLSDIPTGIYFYIVQTESYNEVLRFMKL
jgi:hypothetical protein